MTATHDVLHVVTDTNRRGAQVFATDLHHALESRGIVSEVVALRPGTGASPLDVPTVASTEHASLRRLIARTRTVIAHGSSTLRACALASVGLGTAFVYRSIGDPRFWARSIRRRAMTRVLLTRPTDVVALWDGAATALRSFGVRAERIHLIPQASPMERFPAPTSAERTAARERLGLRRDVSVIAYVGALSEEKRPLDAVRAVARLDDASLVVAGDGPLRRPMRDEAARLLGDRARLLGEVVDVRPILLAADAVVLPSATEGMPGIAIEAGLSTVPVVATDVGGTGAVIVDGQTGYLVPTGSIEEIQQRLRTAIERRDELGRAARARCEAMFTIDAVVEAWTRLIGIDVGTPRRS